MAEDLEPGLHEALVTEALRQRIERARRDGRLVDVKALDDATLARVLAQHIYGRALETFDRVPASLLDRRSEQVGLANRVLEELAAYGASSIDGERISPAAEVLLEVGAPGTSEAGAATKRPGISLRDSILLVNGHRDFQIGTQVALELLSADRVDLLCAFVRFAGIRLIRTELREFLLRGGQMRVICSVYTGSTEKRALDELVGLGAAVKVSYETSHTRLHAKSWSFQRRSGFHSAYVGSSNLTHSALLDGLEWNVRATAVDNAPIIERVQRTFEQYWNEAEFVTYDPRVDGARLEAALDQERGGRASQVTIAPLRIKVEPKPFQAEILEALAAERQRGHCKNLVVAPTGTGKTWIAAFDYQRLRRAGYERLLFVAHRDELLRQSQQVFQTVLGDHAFGERFIGGERPGRWSHVFASIQSISRGIHDLDPAQFDVVIVDEFHHAEAETYTRLLRHLRPGVLLGLTATPERADAKAIFHWFDERVASEMRLWDALDQGLLCPFHYLGVADTADLRGVGFARGRYVASDLEGVYTGDHVRARRILDAVRDWVLDPQRMRALGFCAGVAHARFMATAFNAAGLLSVALDGSTDTQERQSAIERLRRGELRAIFSVDLFNEGVDIPEVDTLLLLRPTESATIFLQQLGRGLRWSEGKSVLTVLDFIGQAHKEYRFDVRFRALIGGTRRQVERAIEHGFPLMPPGCAIRLDELAQQYVLDNLRASIRSTKKLIADELRSLPPTTGLAEFLAQSSFDLPDIYANPANGATFTTLRRAAGHLRDAPASGELEYMKAIGKLLHVDDEERYQVWRGWLEAAQPPPLAAAGSREERLQWMLFAALGQRKRSLSKMAAAFGEFWQYRSLRHEVVDLLDVLRERVRLDSRPIGDGAMPLHSHATYGLYEIVAAYGDTVKGSLREVREGVLWVPGAATDLLFVTLNKSDEDYSPTTRYNDYPISPTLFHWESQSRTATASGTGQRYVHHVARGSSVLLFVREHNRDERGVSAPYLCLGPVRHVAHRSDRPMQIEWQLERQMPGHLFTQAKVAAG